MRRVLCILGLLLAVNLVAGNAEAKKIKIKLATMAPDGSTWHELLKDLAQRWKTVSNGEIDLRIYAGGVAGDEPVMMKKLGINNYHAALVSSMGLGSIDRSSLVFTIPRMLRTDDELEEAMEVMAPELGRRLEERGYIVLGWTEAGWVNFFVPTPDASIAGVRKHKLFSAAGDSKGLELWRAGGFNVVPLPAPELVTGLQTKLVNAFDVPPFYALLVQAFRHTDYMIDMKWAPLPGALIMNKKTWDKIPEELRPALMAEADKFAVRFREETRKMDTDAVNAMQKRGLTVVTPTPEQQDSWDRETLAFYPEVRGFYVSEEDFDWFQSVVKQIRSAR
jgi:TRAP-type C4-dicarboxylate transport system substrate-binding protein